MVRGIARGCELAGCALIGGETAEMPGMYPAGEYDLAGFCVGVVEKERIIDGRSITPGDVLLGLASSGAHSNGYSLIRKIVERAPGRDSRRSLDALMEPTRIYVKPMLKLLRGGAGQGPRAHHRRRPGRQRAAHAARGHAGGARSKTPGRGRSCSSWLQQQGNVAEDEMHRVFNCGIGMVLVVAPPMRSARQASCARRGKRSTRSAASKSERRTRSSDHLAGSL